MLSKMSGRLFVKIWLVSLPPLPPLSPDANPTTTLDVKKIVRFEKSYDNAGTRGHFQGRWSNGCGLVIHNYKERVSSWCRYTHRRQEGAEADPPIFLGLGKYLRGSRSRFMQNHLTIVRLFSHRSMFAFLCLTTPITNPVQVHTLCPKFWRCSLAFSAGRTYSLGYMITTKDYECFKKDQSVTIVVKNI